MRAVKIEMISSQFVNHLRTARGGELFKLHLLRPRDFAADPRSIYVEILENCGEAANVALKNRVAGRKNEKKRTGLANVRYAQFERAAPPAWRERKRGHRNRRSEQEREAEALYPWRWK
jgi:hypothetical protein